MRGEKEIREASKRLKDEHRNEVLLTYTIPMLPKGATEERLPVLSTVHSGGHKEGQFEAISRVLVSSIPRFRCLEVWRITIRSTSLGRDQSIARRWWCVSVSSLR
jgi:hypothetical protein